MANKINRTVENLHGFLPFDPAHEQIYEEYRTNESSLDFETSALGYLREVLDSGEPRVLVLTGDAGHGKTHLCRRLMETHLGYDQAEARDFLKTNSCGESPIRGCVGTDREGVRPLRFYKDLSELPVPGAVAALEEALEDGSSATVVCVNEGRLRAILAAGLGDQLQAFRGGFRLSFDSGNALVSGHNHILNLNYQSVAADDGESRNLLREALRVWLDGNLWRMCGTCDARLYCPILANKQMLRSDDLAARRQARLEEIFATSERLGTVVTIRELLMMVAYLLTGGLKCKDIHQKVGRSNRGWQYEYSFYSVLFETPPSVSPDKASRIPTLRALEGIDPGKVATREVDDLLINKQDVFSHDQVDLAFSFRFGSATSWVDGANGTDDIIANPRNHRERALEKAANSRVVRALRRRHFFDREAPSSGSSLRNLGFEFGDDFLSLLSGSSEATSTVRIKTRLVAGLHTAQGMQVAAATSLRLVDPAFGKTSSHAAIIARTISNNDLKLVPRSSFWRLDPSGEPEHQIPRTVDWLERELLLVVDSRDPDSGPAVYPLDLLSFDLLMRAGSGYVAQDFYAHDLRHILNFLGQLAEAGRSSEHDTIDVLVGGRAFQVTIDEGDIIQVGEGL